MKKRLILGLTVVALALGLMLAACSGGDDDQLPPVASEGPLVFTNTVNGRVVVVTITRTEPSKAAAPIKPQVGDYYVIKLDGKTISYGRITSVTNDGKMTFTPADDSPGIKVAFEGTLDNSGSLYIAKIPYEGGDISGFTATEGSSTSAGGGSSTGNTGGGGGGVHYPQQPQPQTYTLTFGSITLTYTDSAVSTTSKGFGTTHYLLAETFADARTKLLSELGTPDEDSTTPGSLNLYNGTSLSNYSENWVIFEVNDWQSHGYGTSYRLVQNVAGQASGANWESQEVKDWWEPIGGWSNWVPGTGPGATITLLDGSVLALPYSDTEVLNGNGGWKVTTYLLTGTFAAAESDLEAKFGLSFGAEGSVGRISGGLLTSGTGIVFQVMDYSSFVDHPYSNGETRNWYILVECVAGLVSSSISWNPFFRVVTIDYTPGSVITLPDGSSISLPYSAYDEIEWSGIVTKNYLLSGSFASARSTLEGHFGTTERPGALSTVSSMIDTTMDLVVFEVSDFRLSSGYYEYYEGISYQLVERQSGIIGGLEWR